MFKEVVVQITETLKCFTVLMVEYDTVPFLFFALNN